jgi:hypothetical protein
MPKKQKKLAIIIGNAEREIKNLKRKKGITKVQNGRTSEKDLREENTRRYWKEVRARELLQQVSEITNK